MGMVETVVDEVIEDVVDEEEGVVADIEEGEEGEAIGIDRSFIRADDMDLERGKYYTPACKT